MTFDASHTRAYYEYRLDSDRFNSVRFNFGPIGTGTDSEIVFSLHHTDSPVAASWRPLVCEALNSSPPCCGDFPAVTNYNPVPLISERAWLAISPLVRDTCELLPVITPFEGSFFLLHVMRTIDAVDLARSDVARAQTRPKLIHWVNRYAFKPSVLDDVHLFKLPMTCGGGLFFDDLFRSTIETNNLQGLLFIPLSMVDA